MCGIVGYITQEGKGNGLAAREKFLRQALIMGTLRGKDSTGVFYKPHDHKAGTAGWLKNLGTGFEFVHDNDEFRKFERDTYSIAVGHNRAATMGSVTTENAHPFQEGPITLVHNGTLRGTHMLPKTMHQLGIKVDSHCIAHNLAENAPEDIIPLLRGAFALVWHDGRDNTLNIIRNDERPFHMAECANQKTIMFMSEAGMLAAVTDRIDLKMRRIVYPKPGQWLKYHPEDVLNPEIKELKVDQWGGYDTHYGSGWDGWGGSRHRPKHQSPSRRVYDSDTKTWVDRADQARQKRQADNRVHLGGQMMEVPDKAQELLFDSDLLVESRVTFMPMSYSLTEGKQTGIVSGVLHKSGQTAIIYGQSRARYEAYKDRLWTVRGLATKQLDDKKKVVICAVVDTSGEAANDKGSAPRPKGKKESSNHSSGGSSPKEEKESDSGTERELFHEDTLVGPGGHYVSVSTYSKLVSSGCIQCQRHIGLMEAEDIAWVNNELDPLCPECIVTNREYLH